MEEDLAAATSADYTSTGRPSFLEERTGNGDLLSRADYTYDARSRLTSEARGGTSLTFDYDGLNQLTSVTKNGATTSYTYDAAGNRIGGSYLVDAGNQIVQDACCNYLYDAEGNLVERTERASGDVTRFTFDHRNRLMEATRQSGGAVVQVVAFEYDALDRRISVAVDADGDGPLSLARTAFVHDGEHLWAELASDGAVIARYLHGDILDQVLALYTPSEGVAWYLTDEIGTVHDVVDCSASLLNHIDYDAFGDVLTESDAGVGRRFRFAGRDWDAETRLYFFRTRYYDPYLGRFISTDRLGFDGGDANLYRFGNNSPTNLRDPRGTAVFASYAIRLRILLARVAIIRCLGFAVFTNLGEAGIYVLLTSISGGSNVYVGSTVNFAVRFYQHSSSGVGGRGLTIISQIPIRISEAVARNPQLLRTAEQLVINAFGGKAQLLNIRNASRILFCR